MTIHPLRLAVAALPVLAVLGPWSGAHAVTPPDFIPPTGGVQYDVDTTAMTITGNGETYTGTDDNGVARFDFGTVDIPPATLLYVHGTRAFELVASTTMTMDGDIQAPATGAGQTLMDPTLPAPGGPGGGAGGAAGSAGGGMGGGRLGGDDASGGGGGGFGAAGGAGGSASGKGGAGGVAYDSPQPAPGGRIDAGLLGGSGGAGDSAGTMQGGGGGGAIELSAPTLSMGGSIYVDGGDGAYGTDAGTGAGSGGGVMLSGGDVDFHGGISARGGEGGAGGAGGDGGAGGGGRLTLRYTHTLVNTGSAVLPGGHSGYGGGGPSGVPSPDQYADSGYVEVQQIGMHASSASATTRFDAITYGRTVAVSTVLTDDSTSTPIGGATVELYRRTSPDGAWSLVGTRTTTSTGRAGIAVTPHATSDYQWRYAGDADHSPVTSANATVRVVQFVYSHVTDGTVTHGATAAFHVYGWVQPAGTGQRVYLQRKSGTSWVAAGNQLLKNQKLPSGTTRVGYNFTVRAPKAGTFTYRVYKPATTTLDKAYSASQTFRVR